MPAELTGYRVVITGATGGLGQALTTAFWRAGADLLLTGRSADRLRELRASLTVSGEQTVDCFDCDLTRADGPDGLITAAGRLWDRLDVLVNNAGVLGPVGPVWENDWDAWESTLQMNLLAPVKLCRGLIPMMSRRGSILNISGGGATSPRANFSAYGAGKAALVRFSETLAVETKMLGIRVNCIAPGIMRTRMVEQVAGMDAGRCGAQEFSKAQDVMANGGTPPEGPAELAVMLASERGKGINGKLLSAAWDPWRELPAHADEILSSDVYTLRRIVPSDRQMTWGKN